MKFVETIDTLVGAAAPAPWTAGSDPCHFDAPEVRNSTWAIYVPTDEDARLIAALHTAWPKIRGVLLAAREACRSDQTFESDLDAMSVELEARRALASALKNLEDHNV